MPGFWSLEKHTTSKHPWRLTSPKTTRADRVACLLCKEGRWRRKDFSYPRRWLLPTMPLLCGVLWIWDVLLISKGNVGSMTAPNSPKGSQDQSLTGMCWPCLTEAVEGILLPLEEGTRWCGKMPCSSQVGSLSSAIAYYCGNVSKSCMVVTVNGKSQLKRFTSYLSCTWGNQLIT